MDCIAKAFKELFPYAKEGSDGYLYEWKVFIDRRDMEMSNRLIISIVSDPLPFEAFYKKLGMGMKLFFRSKVILKEKSLKNLKRKVMNSSIAMFMIGLRKIFSSISLLTIYLKKMRLCLMSGLKQAKEITTIR